MAPSSTESSMLTIYEGFVSWRRTIQSETIAMRRSNKNFDYSELGFSQDYSISRWINRLTFSCEEAFGSICRRRISSLWKIIIRRWRWKLNCSNNWSRISDKTDISILVLFCKTLASTDDTQGADRNFYWTRRQAINFERHHPVQSWWASWQIHYK